MPNPDSLSKHMQKAAHHLEQAKGKKLTLEAREKEAVSLASLMLQEATRTQTRKEKKAQEQLS